MSRSRRARHPSPAHSTAVFLQSGITALRATPGADHLRINKMTTTMIRMSATAPPPMYMITPVVARPRATSGRSLSRPHRAASRGQRPSPVRCSSSSCPVHAGTISEMTGVHDGERRAAIRSRVLPWLVGGATRKCPCSRHAAQLVRAGIGCGHTSLTTQDGRRNPGKLRRQRDVISGRCGWHRQAGGAEFIVDHVRGSSSTTRHDPR